jgi:alkanesulfonate monooxygenase SsuD/methylene tetrahydromethanopterin reductase-like flavin-dependent oxidoreductase (luciferase family)
LLAEWGDRPAGCLFLLPLWHPVLLAEQVGTLAAIAGGRFILQCGLGDGADQFAALGASLRTRPSAFEESLDAVRRLLAGETVDGGHRFPFRGARVSPVPPEPVEVWVGATGEPAIDRAARLADGWLASPGLTFEQASRLAAVFLERCAAWGRSPTAVAVRRDVYVADSAADADRARAAMGRYRGFDPSALVCGTPDEVAASFRQLAEVGYTDVIVRHFEQDQAKVLGSLARLGEVRAAVAE